MRRAIGIIIGLVAIACPAMAAVDVPQMRGFVTDTSHILHTETETQLEDRLTAYERETGTEIAVLTIPLIPDGQSANEYATDVGNAWGIGKKGVDNGALLVIETDDAPGQRDIYIATGSQTEGGLTDVASHAIVDEVIIPRFRAGDIDGGVTAGVDAMIAALDGESFTDLRMGDASTSDVNVGHLIFFGIIALQWLAAILGRSKSIWLGGVIGSIAGGVLGFVFFTSLIAIGGSVLGLALLGLGFDAVVSHAYRHAGASGTTPPWWTGGGWGGGTSGGGGFGGFGGGGFSGGGGGGRW